MHGDMPEEDGAEDDSREAAEQHETEHTVVDLFADDLDGDDDEFDDGGVGKRGADGDLDGHVEEEDQQRSGNDSGADAAQRDDNGDAKSDDKIHVDTLSGCVLRGLQVDAAFLFLATPTSGARVIGIKGQDCAGLTADAGVALVVEREKGDVVLVGVVPDVLRCPLGERADLADSSCRGQSKVLSWLQCGATLCLFAAEPGEPQIVGLERGEERFDLSETATAAGIGLVEDAELCLLLGYREFGQKVDEVHRPGSRHVVAILIDFGEVVAGVEENDGNVGQSAPNHVEHDHVLRLEAIGDADVALGLVQARRSTSCSAARIFSAVL